MEAPQSPRKVRGVRGFVGESKEKDIGDIWGKGGDGRGTGTGLYDSVKNELLVSEVQGLY